MLFQPTLDIQYLVAGGSLLCLPTFTFATYGHIIIRTQALYTLGLPASSIGNNFSKQLMVPCSLNITMSTSSGDNPAHINLFIILTHSLIAQCVLVSVSFTKDCLIGYCCLGLGNWPPNAPAHHTCDKAPPTTVSLSHARTLDLIFGLGQLEIVIPHLVWPSPWPPLKPQTQPVSFLLFAGPLGWL